MHASLTSELAMCYSPSVACAAQEAAAQPSQQRMSCGKQALTAGDVSVGVRQRVGTDRFSLKPCPGLEAGRMGPAGRDDLPLNSN